MTTINYFENCNTIEEIKARFRELAKRYHPDLNGNSAESTATMQLINSQYHAALKRGNGQVSKDETGREHTYHYNQDLEQIIFDKILELVALDLQNCQIALIGTWIWILGETKPRKDDLKKIGCKWHSKRGCWYWRSQSQKRYMHSHGNLCDLAAKYGYKDVSNFRSRNDEEEKQKRARITA